MDRRSFFSRIAALLACPLAFKRPVREKVDETTSTYGGDVVYHTFSVPDPGLYTLSDGEPIVWD